MTATTPPRRHIHIAVREDVSLVLTTMAHEGYTSISEIVELLVGRTDPFTRGTIVAELRRRRDDECAAKKGAA